MQHAKLIALVGALALGGALPVAAETLWVGQGFITAASAICGVSGMVGDYDTVIYRPVSTALGNSGDSYLAWISTRSNFTMLVPNAPFRAGVNYGGAYVGSHLMYGSNVGGITAWDLTPPVPTASVATLRLTATFANFYAVPACTVSISAILQRTR